MLFEVSWSGVSWHKKPFADIVKEAPPEDSFVLILSYHQIETFKSWISTHEIPVQYEMLNPISNIVHKENGRSLHLYILGNGPKLTPSVYKERVKSDTIKPVLIVPPVDVQPRQLVAF